MTKSNDQDLVGWLRLALGRQAGTAIKVLNRGATLETVDPLTQKIRISICEGCDDFVEDTRQCNACTCPLDYKTTLLYDPVKQLLGGGSEKELTRCPRGKW